MLNNRQSNRRRGRGRGPQSNNGRQDNGSRIDNRARGNAPQMLEKYKNLAREAQLQGDRVLTEYYLQFSDHYFRIVAENRARFEENRQPRRDEWSAEDGVDGDADDYGRGHPSESQDDGYGAGETRQEQGRQPRNRGERREPTHVRDAGDRGDQAQDTTIDVSILPPALGVTADAISDVDEEPAPPRRRSRPRRASASEVDAATAE
ncbi:MAG: hypothetical protein RLZZ561_973 [Pseudomonadota bacterium]